MKSNWKKIGATVMLSAFLMTNAVPAVSADDTDDKLLEYQIVQEQLKRDIANSKKEINNLTVEKNQVLKELKSLNDNLTQIQNQIALLDIDISNAVAQIDYTQMEINNKQRDLDGRMAIFSNRLKEIYMYGDVDFLEVLLQSSDLTDFLTRFEYLKYIADNDQQLMEEVKVLKAGLEEQKADLESQKAKLEAKRKEHVTRSEELKIASAKQQELAQTLQDDIDNQMAILDATEEESNKIAAQIVNLQSKGGTAPSASQFVWPCPASKRVTSSYGTRIHPIKKTKSTHTGVDIGAPSGSNIVAAAPGKVIMATYNSAYGNYMIVDHGGGLSTMYAHQSAFVAKVGDAVLAGDVIGKVGSTGLSTGPHLHFEVRINGQHTSPNKYIGL